MDSVKVRVPVLARLLLAELAERRGLAEGTLLADLIRREAVADLTAPVSGASGAAGAVTAGEVLP